MESIEKTPTQAGKQSLQKVRMFGTTLILFFGFYFYFQHTLPQKVQSLARPNTSNIILEVAQEIRKKIDTAEKIILKNESPENYLLTRNFLQEESFPFHFIKQMDSNLLFYNFLPFYGVSEDYIADFFGRTVKNHAGKILIDSQNLDAPTGLTQNGEVLYIADAGLGQVLQYDGELKVLVDELIYPTGLTYLDGKLYIADTEANQVYIFENGEKAIFAGTGESGYSGDNKSAKKAILNGPTGLSINESHLFVADSKNNVIRAIDLNSHIISTIAGNKEFQEKNNCTNLHPTKCALNFPTAIHWNNDELLIGDTFHNRVLSIKKGTVDNKVNSLHFFNTSVDKNIEEPYMITVASNISQPLGIFKSQDQFAIVSLDQKDMLQAYFIHKRKKQTVGKLSRFVADQFFVHLEHKINLNEKSLTFEHLADKQIVKLIFDDPNEQTPFEMALMY